LNILWVAYTIPRIRTSVSIIMTSLFSILRPKQLGDLKPLPFFMVKILVPQVRYYMKNWLSSGFSAPFEALENADFNNFSQLLLGFEAAYMSETGVDMISWVSKSLGTALFSLYLDKKLIQYYSDEFNIKNTPQYKANIFTVAARSQLLSGDNTFQSHITWDLVNLASALNHIVSIPTHLFQAERSMRLIQEAIVDTKSISSFDSKYFILGLAGVTILSAVSGIAIKKWCTDLCKAEYDNKRGVLDVAKAIEQNIDTIESRCSLNEHVSFIADSQWNAVKFRIKHDVVDYSGDFLQAAVSSSVFLLSFYFLKQAILGNGAVLDRGEVTLLINKIFSEANTMIKIGSGLNKAYIGIVYAKDSWEKLSNFIHKAEEVKVKVQSNTLNISHIEQEDSKIALSIKNFEMKWSGSIPIAAQTAVVRYQNVTQIDEADFQYGQKYYLKGETGAGKTTVIHHILYGYSHAESMKGDVQISKKIKHLITLPNHGNKNLTKILRDFGSETAKKYIAALRLTDVFEQKLDRAWNTFSAGEQKRIALLEALLTIENDSLLILDESFNSIDRKVKKDVEALVDEVAKDKNLCLIMVDHQIKTKNHNIVTVTKNTQKQEIVNVMKKLVIQQAQNNNTLSAILGDFDQAAAKKYIEVLECSEILKGCNKHWNEFNSNEQKRIALLHALLNIKEGTQYIILDEPFRDLDSKMQIAVSAMLNDVIKMKQVSLVVVERKEDDRPHIAKASKRMKELTVKDKNSTDTLGKILGNFDSKTTEKYINALHLTDALKNMDKHWNEFNANEQKQIAILDALIQAEESKHSLIIEAFSEEYLNELHPVSPKEEDVTIDIYNKEKPIHAHPAKTYWQSFVGMFSDHSKVQSETPACCAHGHGHGYGHGHS
jgi:ABC-type multidrug transport system ATPase subunit